MSITKLLCKMRFLFYTKINFFLVGVFSVVIVKIVNQWYYSSFNRIMRH